jgi:hypothetical protein
MSIVQRGRKKPGRLVYGFRITVRKPGQASTTLPTIFSACIPEQWAALQNDASIVAATLRKRGRVIEQYRQ